MRKARDKLCERSRRSSILIRRRWMSCQNLIGNTAQSVLVTLLADIPLKLLWRHITCIGLWMGNIVCHYARQHEVSQQGMTIAIKQYVCGFDVTVQNIPGVGIGESLSYLYDHLQSLT